MFSLCIPTLDRYDKFLSIYVKKYLENPLIDEIIINDENGNDYEKLLNEYKDTDNISKLKIYKNDNILGPFLNKIKVCKYAKNNWICLMDSDNFADIQYFEIVNNYIMQNKLSDYCILSPNFAFPNFNYSNLTGKIITKNNIRNISEYDKISGNVLELLLNTGNYVLNKKLINNLDITQESNIHLSSACDVIYMNTLFLEQFELEFHVLCNKYSHVVHDGSVYTNTINNTRDFASYVHDRFRKLLN